MSETETEASTKGTFTLKVPDVGEGVAEVEIVSWTVQVGDTVARLQTVAEVMTDKATVEVPSPIAGVVAELGGAVGDVLLVGSPLLRLSVGGGAPPGVGVEVGVDEAPRSVKPPAGVELRPHATGAPAADTATVAAAAAETAPTAARAAETAPTAARAAETAPTVDAGPSAGRRPAVTAVPSRRRAGSDPSAQAVLATPAVRRRARDAGVDLRQVRAAGHATGPAGRITHEDLDRYLTGGLRGAGPGGVAAPTGAPGLAREARSGSTRQPMVGLRRRIAHRMVTSATTIPHITYVEEVDVTALEDLRTTLNDRGADNPNQPRLTVLPFLVRALTNILADFPIFNAHLEEAGAGGPVGDAGPTEATGTDTLTVYDGIHVGIATQTDNGLIVPVLRHAEAHTIWSAASAIAELSEGTRSGTAPADALSGSTITITSLGALGGIVSTPIINKPEVAIVGVNKIAIRPVWDDGEFVPRKIMNLSCSFDHRVIDGWDAANFVQAIRIQLERPALLFIDELGPGPPEAGS